MSSLKSTLVGLLVVVLVLAGGYVAYNRTNGFGGATVANLKLPPAAAGVTASLTNALGSVPGLQTFFSEENLTPLVNSAGQQAAILGDRLGTSQEVLGSFVEVNENDPSSSLSNQVLTKAQYLYCQAVVDEWKRKQEKEATLSETPI
jgi:hypothetical protein